MKIEIDSRTLDDLRVAASRSGQSAEHVAANWLRQQSRLRRFAEATANEDLARLADVRESGGIAHDEMLDWLDSLIDNTRPDNR